MAVLQFNKMFRSKTCFLRSFWDQTHLENEDIYGLVKRGARKELIRKSCKKLKVNFYYLFKFLVPWWSFVKLNAIISPSIISPLYNFIPRSLHHSIIWPLYNFTPLSFHPSIVSSLYNFTPRSIHPSIISPLYHFKPLSFHPSIILPLYHFTHLSFQPSMTSPLFHFMPL